MFLGYMCKRRRLNMPQNSVQKVKLMKIWEILQQNTDSDHPLTTRQLIKELEKLGVSCERRTLYRDIKTLNQNGYEVISGRNWQENTYYVKNRKFKIPEIKIVMDAVQNSAFISPEITDELLDKLANLSGSYGAELLKRNTIHFETVKHNNKNIYSNVEVLEKALEQKQKISFYYYHLNENAEKVYAHSKQSYEEEPIGMIVDDGNYYLLCYRNEIDYKNNVKIFRIDRMDHIVLKDRMITKEASSVLRKINHYKLQAFKMYGGELKGVTLQFAPELIEVVFDKFGYNVRIRRSGNQCRVTVDVQISPTFWGWMMQFPTKMKIESPEYLRQEYYEWVKSALKE